MQPEQAALGWRKAERFYIEYVHGPVHHAVGLRDLRKAVSRVEPDGGGEVRVRFEIERFIPMFAGERLDELQKPAAKSKSLRLVREIELLRLRAVFDSRKLRQSPAAEQVSIFVVHRVIDAPVWFFVVKRVKRGKRFVKIRRPRNIEPQLLRL